MTDIVQDLRRAALKRAEEIDDTLLHRAAAEIERLTMCFSDGMRRIAELEAVIQRYEDEATK